MMTLQALVFYVIPVFLCVAAVVLLFVTRAQKKHLISVTSDRRIGLKDSAS